MRRVAGDFRGSERRPFTSALVRLPRLGVAAYMDLLVDTGADFTSIHWTDRERLHDVGGSPLPANATFLGAGSASGISGSSVAYGVETADIYFLTEDKEVLVEVVDVRIALDDASAEVPSLLGRDVLSGTRLDFDMPTDRLVLEWSM